jgi:hypothetical protein
MSDSADLTAALAPVAAAFQRLGVRHYIGGSVASTIHGAVRSTMDVDVVCELAAAHMRLMAESVGVIDLLNRLLAEQPT